MVAPGVFSMKNTKKKSSGDAGIVTTTTGTFIGKLVPGCFTTELADSQRRKEVV
jgi:hypothetical protein